MRAFLAISAVVALAGLVLPVTARAQEGDGGFFQRDFAASPLEDAATTTGAKSSRVGASSAQAQSVDAGAKFDEVELPGEAESRRGDGITPEVGGPQDGEGAASSGSSSSAAQVAGNAAEGAVEKPSGAASSSSSSEQLGRGIKIEQLSLVANAVNEEHALEALTSMRELIVEKELLPGAVYLVGLAAEAKLEALSLMVRRMQFLGAEVSANPTELPVPVKLSPIWIIETAAGRYIVEGTMQLDRFINARGEFVKPGDAELALGAEMSAAAAASAGGSQSVAVSQGAESQNSEQSSSERSGIIPD